MTGTGYNYVALANDLSDLFVPQTIPAWPSFAVERSRLFQDPLTHHAFQFLNIRNISSTPAAAPLFLVLDNLSPNATLVNAKGTTSVLPPLGSPYLSVPLEREFDGDVDFLRPGQAALVVLEFLDPSNTEITYDTRVLSVTPTP